LSADARKKAKMSTRITTDHTVTIDYGMTVEQMVEAGNYDWNNRDINSRNFPAKGDGAVETTLELVHLNKVARTAEVEAYLKANGLRAATLAELLAFGAKYPEIQLEFPVVALGSSWFDPLSDRYVPYLFRRGSERTLSLVWRGYDWIVDCRFLAVRK
jgi:hypothetical protein